MKKSQLNLLIDAIMLIVMMGLIGVGLLNKYVLLSGQKKWEKYGDNLELTLFGFDRHDWNIIHFVLGVILFGLLVFHIWFHWKMIISIYRSIIKNKTTRIALSMILLAVSTLLLVFPFITNATFENHIDRQSHQLSETSNIEVKGRMTLKQIATLYNVPIDYIKSELEIPSSISENESLRNLKRSYEFSSSDIESIISMYQNRKTKNNIRKD